MTLSYKNEKTLYIIFKNFKMTLNYKNEETLYVIFFLYVKFSLICYTFEFF